MSVPLSIIGLSLEYFEAKGGVRELFSYLEKGEKKRNNKLNKVRTNSSDEGLWKDANTPQFKGRGRGVFFSLKPLQRQSSQLLKKNHYVSHLFSYVGIRTHSLIFQNMTYIHPN